MKLSTAAKKPYRGGSKRIFNSCGKRTCPVNEKIIKILYYERNKEAVKARAAARPAEIVREHKRKWKQKNRHAVAASVASRKWFVKKATPKWLSKEQKDLIKSFYLEAERLKVETGVDHEVDHIVPLRGEFVSGLHVPWNLRVVTAAENQSKNRRFVEALAVAL